MNKPKESLAQWLDHLSALHPQEIELGLERVASVWQRMHPAGVHCPVIMVGGTNGKGSSVALLEAILQAGGYVTGCYTSPHLLRFNERMRLNGSEATDEQIMQAFARVEALRQGVSLTYFEFATLAALELFVTQRVDVMLLEVGLGGRLDAVNILDADVSIVTTVDLDHCDWLGHDREQIALEKAAIYRPGRAAVFAALNPPLSLVQYAQDHAIPLRLAGRDYTFEKQGDHWGLKAATLGLSDLPLPRLVGAFQVQNAAGVLMALDALSQRLPLTQDAIHRGLREVQLAGRFQQLAGRPGWLLDVAHNPEAARSLALNLADRPVRRAVFSMLADKAVAEVVACLAPHIHHWYIAPLNCPRALGLEPLAGILAESAPQAEVQRFEQLEEALEAARRDAHPSEQILVAGSFYSVAAAMAWLGPEAIET